MFWFTQFDQCCKANVLKTQDSFHHELVMQMKSNDIGRERKKEHEQSPSNLYWLLAVALFSQMLPKNTATWLPLSSRQYFCCPQLGFSVFISNHAESELPLCGLYPQSRYVQFLNVFHTDAEQCRNNEWIRHSILPWKRTNYLF